MEGQSIPATKRKMRTDFIKEMTRLFNNFNNDTKWKRVSLTMLHIFIPMNMMLQKPAPKSKARINAKYLTKRLQYWREGNLTKIFV
jgi:hypothetical protein